MASSPGLPAGEENAGAAGRCRRVVLQLPVLLQLAPLGPTQNRLAPRVLDTDAAAAQRIPATAGRMPDSTCIFE